MAVVTPWLELLEPLSEAPPAPNSGGAGWDDAVPALSPVDWDSINAKAEDILASARAEAAELVEDAQVQAEALREAAWQEGFHSGKQEAKAATETELRREWNGHKAALRAELDDLITQIISAREELWQRQEQEMVGLALDIARQVVKGEVTQNPEVVRQVISNAIRRITDKENVRIRVSVADAPRVKEMREELLEITDGLRHLEIIDDRRIGEGGCVIETNAGTIDAKIETQLAEVGRALGAGESGS